jgi:hypothetical protein
LLWFCLPVLLRGSHFQVVLRSLNGQRYEVVPVLALALALLVAVAGAESAERVSNRAVILACAFLVAMMALNLTQPSSRSGGPHYRATVAQARLLCHDQPVDPASNVRRLPGNTVSIPVSPRVPPGQRAPWFVVVPCGRLG